MGASPEAIAAPARIPRVRVFVDYWNLQLTLNQRIQTESRQANVRFQIDWRALSAWLAGKGGRNNADHPTVRRSPRDGVLGLLQYLSAPPGNRPRGATRRQRVDQGFAES